MRQKSNASFVREGFDLIVPVLEEYIGIELVPFYGSNSWDVILQKLEYPRELPENGRLEDNLRKLDLANCLRLIDRLWGEVFRRKQPVDFRTYSKELMGVRNEISHLAGKDISEDDAWRDLDTMRRMMETVDPGVANELGDLLRELRYGSKEGSIYTAEVTSDIKKFKGILQEIDNNLPSWRDIIEPHPDVARGLYQKAEFAADLAQVARHDRRTAIEYSDPVEFFSRTYITEGMKGLLTQALDRITGKGGDPVIQLKTAFGGGKTHSMLALYHMLGGAAPLKQLPVLEPVLKEAGLSALPKANIAVLVGTSMDPSSVKRPSDFPGVTVSTIWGDLAMQLAKNSGNNKLYDIVKEADKKHVSPGSEKLKELLDEAGPCLILMDELVAYGKKLYGRNDLPAGTFDNFITFIQELTEAARASKDSLVVASIPESENEIGGDAGQKTLEAIEHTFGRMETIWKPVGLNEGFEVVRRRLFLDCKDPKKRDAVCEAFSALYQSEKEHFPYETRDINYLSRMKACYPIHPEVFDRLFNDWATLERFQRTRGVLRLMASVIHALWMGGDASAMIMPGSLPLDSSPVRDELTRTLPDNGWNSIILSEVDGTNSVPYKIDSEKERFGKYMAARWVARTVFLGSAPTSKHQTIRGMDVKQIHLGVVQPGEPVSVFSDALNTLKTRCAYLYSSRNDERFWYDLRPTLLKTANDRMEQIRIPECDALIEKHLKKMMKTSSAFCGIHICPSGPGDIPDEQKVRLVVLKPDKAWSEKKADSPACLFAEEVLNSRGNTPRKYKNTLIFLAPNEQQRMSAVKAAKELIAWDSISRDKEDLNLDQKQLREVSDQISQKEENLNNRIRELYSVEMAPIIDLEEDAKKIRWENERLSGSEVSIAQKAGNIAFDAEMVIEELAPIILTTILNEFVWDKETSIQIRTLWDYLTTYLYMPRLKDFSVLQKCIVAGVADKNFFGLASGKENDYFLNLKYAESVPTVHPSDYLVEPKTAMNQLIVNPPKDPVLPEHPVRPEPVDDPSKVEPIDDKICHFRMKKSNFDLARINRQFGDIVSEILNQLTEKPQNQVQVTLSINAYIPDGLNPSEQRALAENCKSLHIRDFEIDK